MRCPRSRCMGPNEFLMKREAAPHFAAYRGADGAARHPYPAISELDRIVHLPALRTARAIHIGIVGVDAAALLATKDAVAAGRGIEAALAEFGVNSRSRERRQQEEHVSKNELRKGHGYGAAGAFVGDSRMVCHSKTRTPMVSCDDGSFPGGSMPDCSGANRAARASFSAS
jgi:hypothetical protein